MPFDIKSQPMQMLLSNHDSEGRLIFADGKLNAIIVRLDGGHSPEPKQQWRLEAGFGRCKVSDAPLFATPKEAEAWVRQRLTSDA